MQHIFPDYYKDFHCINRACQHNCCIGWEIDIDEDTAEFYRSQPAICEKITWDEPPHFILAENDRCPFLTSDNLCRIIIEKGEEALCNICADHPRFRNELPDRVEIGLGLACEEAARLILGRRESMHLLGVRPSDDAILQLRDQVFSVLQDRQCSILQRIRHMLELCHTDMPDISWEAWIDLLLSLERLDPTWTTLLESAKQQPTYIEEFNEYMADRQHEYEQFLVYLIYRHFANAYDEEDAALRALFAIYSCQLLWVLGACTWSKTGSFSFEQQVELARMFSSEIEYSDENLDIILDELSF